MECEDKVDIVREWKLNYGLFLKGNDFKPAEKPILNDGEELSIIEYDGEPLVYVSFKHVRSSGAQTTGTEDLKSSWELLKDTYNLEFPKVVESETVFNIPESDACILFPIAKVTYNGSCDIPIEFKSQLSLFQEYGNFVARKLLVGGKIYIRNFINAKGTQVNELKAHLMWAFEASRMSRENLFEGVSISHLPMIETDKEILQTPKKLMEWFRSLYEENFAEIISYEELTPVLGLITEAHQDSSISNSFIKRLIPGLSRPFMEVKLYDWAKDATAANLLTWIEKFKVSHGILINSHDISFSKECIVDFTQNIDISSKKGELNVRVVCPNTDLDEYLLNNRITYSFNDPDELFLNKDNIFSKVNRNSASISNRSTNIYCIFEYEAVEINIRKEFYKVKDEFIKTVNKALDSMRPYQALQDIFGKFGHLWPQKIILGKRFFQKYSRKINPDKYLRSEGMTMKSQEDIENFFFATPSDGFEACFII
ncbi:1052_t:CDS:1 [Acaulospora colombiana]|uniref:1052_t:CDS:1 n=1 Tax=Acaulospora colombiana TaxID=27376 RepID=A0ACA9M669_9GLOM|nr:1052_t:CDS:1 [Acaulospora colombiana]